MVCLEGRGDLPFATVHRRSLLEHAVAALRPVCPVTVTGEPGQLRRARRTVPGVRVCSPEEFWQEAPHRVLVHDCLCPLVPTDFLAGLAAAEENSAAYRPVTDTLKVVHGDVVGGTLDREQFGIVTSPVLVIAPSGRPPVEDFSDLLVWLRARGPVALVRAPQDGRRAVDVASVDVLESLDAVRRTLRHDD